MSEHQEQVTFFQILRLNEKRFPYLKFIYAVPNGGKRHVGTARKLKAEGVKSGVSDICLPIPRFDNPGAYIEMKFGKNKMTEPQNEFAEFIISQGYAFKCCYTATEALEFVENYFGIKLNR